MINGQAAIMEGKWTISTGLKVLSLFVFAALLEIVGGWLVWRFIRERRETWNLIVGFIVLALYGVIPCLQPLDDFGRVYAAYGGVFIACSYAWARVVDGFRLDAGDYVGASLSIAGVFVALLWPRDGNGLQQTPSSSTTS